MLKLKRVIFLIITYMTILLHSFDAYGGKIVGPGDFSELGGFVLTIPYSYDSKNNVSGKGIDLNLVLYILNASLVSRSWNEDIVGWNKNILQNEFTVYLGMGFVNLIQLQAGYSEAGTSLRLRSDLVLSKEKTIFPFGFPHRRDSKAFLVVSPFIEAAPWASNKRVVCGMGVGIVF